jgi:hypothetical protein
MMCRRRCEVRPRGTIKHRIGLHTEGNAQARAARARRSSGCGRVMSTAPRYEGDGDDWVADNDGAIWPGCIRGSLLALADTSSLP